LNQAIVNYIWPRPPCFRWCTTVSKFSNAQSLRNLSKATLLQVVHDCLKILKRSIAEKPQVKFTFEPGKGFDPAVEYKADSTRLRQILVNLISNALKFTNAGHVTLKVNVTGQGMDDVVYFEVTDTGLGLAPDGISKIFPISSTLEAADGTGTETSGKGGVLNVGSTPRRGHQGAVVIPSHHAPYVSGTQSDLRTFQGTGLGLRLCQLLTSVMSGCMGCRSVHPPVTNPDGSSSGSTFWFEVPLVRLSRRSPITDAHHKTSSPVSLPRPSQGRFSSQLGRESHVLMEGGDNSDSDNEQVMDTSSGFTRQPNRARRMNFLVVDDMKINRQILRTILHKLGHSIQEAENGEQALQMVETHPFHLIFMDVRMPVLGGREATLRIRSHPNEQLRNIPIVAITGDVCDADVKRSMDAGMNAVLTKPITREDVVKVISRF